MSDDKKPSMQVTVRQGLSSLSTEFEKMLPQSLPSARFIRVAQTAIATAHNIDKVQNPKSLYAACMKAAADGVLIDGYEAALIIDYKGDARYQLMRAGRQKILYASGQVSKISVQIVYEKDEFEYALGDDEHITHKVNVREDRGAPYAAYAIGTLKDGAVIREVMSKKQIEDIRDRSDAWKAFKASKIKDTPWHSDPDEMWRKTVFNRLYKYLPKSGDRDLSEDDDDVYHAIEHEAEGSAPAAPVQTRKKRGGAAAIMKDITPPEADRQEDDGLTDDEPYDQETGEILEHELPQEDF